MLIALCRAHRAQILVNIDIRIKQVTNSMEIRISELIKTSGPERFQPNLIIPKFNEEQELCVASVLNRYLEVTGNIEGI